MANKHSAKRKLIASMLVLCLCFSMLVGTTLAWFTDEVSSNNNVIQTGKLDVALYYADGEDAVPQDKDWTKVTDQAIFTKTNWEPGFIEAKHLRIANEGTLALKYQMRIITNGDAGKLADVIDVYYFDEAKQLTRDDFTSAKRLGTLTEVLNPAYAKALSQVISGSLEAGKAKNITLAFKMQESADNEYQELTIGAGFSIQIVATQVAAENDSFDNKYDEGADFAGEISNATSFAAALAAGGTYKLIDNIDLTTSAIVPSGKTVVLNMNGYNVVCQSGNAIKNNGNLTINGVAAPVTYNLRSVSPATNVIKSLNNYAIYNAGKLVINNVTLDGGINNGGDVLINSGKVFTTFGGGAHAIYHVGTSLVINDGEFSGNGNEVINANVGEGAPVTINGGIFDKVEKSSYLLRGPKIVIYDGVFNAYDENGEDPAKHFASVKAIYGGTFNYKATPAAGFLTVDNEDGTFLVLPSPEGDVSLSIVAGYPGLYTDGTNYYTYTAEGLISMRNFWKANWCDNNMWGRSYNVMADIDATGYTWDEVWVNVGHNDNAGFVFDGTGHTITGLTINGALFSGTPNGGNNPEKPGYVQNITFDNVTVVGDHFAAVLWTNVYNELVVENVTVKNSTITGNCNVAALVGASVMENSPDAKVVFKNCVVENNVITANGKDGQDPTGASAFISRAYANTSVIFEGINQNNNNTIVNENGLVGGGVYGYTTWANGGFYATGSSDEFVNWYGYKVVSTSDALLNALRGEEEVINIILDNSMDVDISTGNYFGGENTKLVKISGREGIVLNLSNTYRSYFKLKNADAVLCLENLELTNAHKGTHFQDYTTQFDCNLVANGVNFSASPLIGSGQTATFNDCEFTEPQSSGYGLWICSGATVTVNGGVVTADRGIKITDEDAAKEKTVLNVSGTKFNTTAKAAILVTTAYGAKVTVDNLDITNVAEDSIHEVWLDEDRNSYFDTVEVVGGTMIREAGYVTSTEKLAAAIEKGVTELWLAPGEYNFTSVAQGKTLTVNGLGEGVVINVKPSGQGEAGGQLDYSLDGSKVTFNKVTIKTNSQLYAGFARLSATYNNCIIQNTYNLGAGTSAFNDCEINITNEYLRVAGATTASFTRCTFNTIGRAILIFQDGTNVNQNVTITDCVFNATASATTWNGIHVSAVSIDGTNGKYVVNINGYNKVSDKFNGLWQIKAGGENVKLYINGDDPINTIKIGTKQELIDFANDVNVNGNTYSGKTVVLTANIDLENMEWTPIGQTGGNGSATYFQGTFDGKGYTISNLKISQNNTYLGGHYASGLFGFVDAADANIKNLTINGADVTGTHWTGVIAGYLTGRIENCKVYNAKVTCNHANEEACGDKAGVIVGYINSGYVVNCYAEECTVTAGRDAGVIIGAAGEAHYKKSTGNEFKNCSVSATGDCTGANINTGIIGRIS